MSLKKKNQKITQVDLDLLINSALEFESNLENISKKIKLISSDDMIILLNELDNADIDLDDIQENIEVVHREIHERSGFKYCSPERIKKTSFFSKFFQKRGQ